MRLPPLLPSTINGLATPAASPDRSSAKRLNASTGNGGDEEFSCTDDITLEMGYDAVSYGSAGRVYRGKIGGASVLIKVSHAYDGLASEMENYRKLEMALGREGEEGLEPLTPVVGGRFCSDTGEGEMIIMEDAGMVMSHFSDWTREQKCVACGLSLVLSLTLAHIFLPFWQAARSAPPRAATPSRLAAWRRCRAQLRCGRRRDTPPHQPRERAGSYVWGEVPRAAVVQEDRCTGRGIGSELFGCALAVTSNFDAVCWREEKAPFPSRSREVSILLLLHRLERKSAPLSDRSKVTTSRGPPANLLLAPPARLSPGCPTRSLSDSLHTQYAL